MSQSSHVDTRPERHHDPSRGTRLGHPLPELKNRRPRHVSDTPLRHTSEVSIRDTRIDVAEGLNFVSKVEVRMRAIEVSDLGVELGR